MKTPALALALVLVALVQAGAPRAAEDPLAEIERRQTELFARVAPSVAYIDNGAGFGSGFFVDARGLLLTNAHVVGRASTVEVVLHDGRRVTGTVVERGAGNIDLALVEVKVEGVQPLPLAVDVVPVGAWVASVGHGLGGVWSYSTGMVSNVYPVGSENPVIQTQIPLHPGSSGGPIVDRHGRAVAVVTSGARTSSVMNFGLLVADALERLTRLDDVPCECTRVHAPAGTPVFVDGRLHGLGPRLIVPVAPKARREVRAAIGGQMIVKTTRGGGEVLVLP